MRILFLTHRLPYAPNRGDRIRAYHLLRSLTEWATVDLLSLVHDDDEAARVRDLDARVASVSVAPVPRVMNLARALIGLSRSKPLTHALLDSPRVRPALREIAASRRPNLILAYCSGMAQYLSEPSLRAIPSVVDMVDVDSLKWEELAPAERFPKSWILRREAHALRAFEADIAPRAAACLTVNEREREALQRLAPGAHVVTVPNGIDYLHFAPPTPPAATADVVFCGVMSYAPNERAALWMADEVWPRVRAARPDARFVIVGADPTPAIRALEQRHAGIAITGAVADVRPYLWKAAVAVAPILVARGLQNKVLEAVAAGLPCVVTPAVAEGLPREIRDACPVAADPQPFAERVLAILDMEPQARRSLAARADITALAWTTRLAPVRALIEEAARRPPAGGGADPG